MNNVVILVGRIAKDLELRCTPNGTQVVEISIAVNNGQDDTSFVKVNCFNNMAETVNKYCKKGDLLGIQAKVKNHNWTDKEGKKHYDYNFIANNITFLQTKPKSEVAKTEENASKEKQAADMQETSTEKNDPYAEFGQEVEITDEDLPF